MIGSFLFALLPIAATCGWYAGRQSRSEEQEERQVSPLVRRDYFRGLNYLINEQPDKAVDVFIQLLEVDSDTVETHLALGTLFRRRGEVERAIRIHQNLIARPSLSINYRILALSELGQDYLRAGVLDRAERLFLEVISLERDHQSSYQFLLTIYQQEKDWLKAVAIAEKLENLGQSMKIIIAQYFCELAQETLMSQDTVLSLQYLQQALLVNPACVRALLIYAELEIERGGFDAAQGYLQQIIRQSPEYLPLTLSSLERCYHELDQTSALYAYLETCLSDQAPLSLVLAMTQHWQCENKPDKALDFLSAWVHQQPSMAGIHALVRCYLHADFEQSPVLQSIESLLSVYLAHAMNYRCSHCGFSSKSLFWLCPSCHHWETLKPINTEIAG